MKAVKPNAASRTLLHFLAQVINRQERSLILFLEEMPHLEAAARSKTIAFFPDASLLMSSG